MEHDKDACKYLIEYYRATRKANLPSELKNLNGIVVIIFIDRPSSPTRIKSIDTEVNHLPCIGINVHLRLTADVWLPVLGQPVFTP